MNYCHLFYLSVEPVLLVILEYRIIEKETDFTVLWQWQFSAGLPYPFHTLHSFYIDARAQTVAPSQHIARRHDNLAG